MAFKLRRKPSGKGGAADLPGVAFDRANGVPAVALAVTQLAAGDWRSIEDAHGESRDWDTRGGVVQALGDLNPSEEWIANCPRSALAHAVRGSQLRRMAWDVRGSGKGSTVSRTAFTEFIAILRQAEHALRIAIELAPEDPDPWPRLIWTGTGLEAPKEEILRRFAAMQERDAGYIYGWLAVTSSMAKKWGGSHELMFSIARQGDRDLPPGSVGRVGLVRAHEERRLYLSQWEDDPDGARNYFKRVDVAGELSAAASNSVLSDQHRPGGSTRLAQSWFAYALALVGDAVPAQRLRAASLFLDLGDSGIPREPWTTRYGTGAAEQFPRIRALCYRAARV